MKTFNMLAFGREIAIDCSYPREHERAGYHQPHPEPHPDKPESTRRVCICCHTPAALLRQPWEESRGQVT